MRGRCSSVLSHGRGCVLQCGLEREGLLQCSTARGSVLQGGLRKRCTSVWSHERDTALQCGPVRGKFYSSVVPEIGLVFCSVIPLEGTCTVVWSNETGCVLQCGHMRV